MYEPEQALAAKEKIVDSGSGNHLISEEELSPEETATITKAQHALRLLTANGVVGASQVAQVLSKQLGALRTVLLPNSPAVLSLGRLVAELG